MKETKSIQTKTELILAYARSVKRADHRAHFEVTHLLLTHTDSGIPCWDPAVSTAFKPRMIQSRRLVLHACANRSFQTPNMFTSAARKHWTICSSNGRSSRHLSLDPRCTDSNRGAGSTFTTATERERGGEGEKEGEREREGEKEGERGGEKERVSEGERKKGKIERHREGRQGKKERERETPAKFTDLCFLPWDGDSSLGGLLFPPKLIHN